MKDDVSLPRATEGDAQLAEAVLAMRPTQGIPSWMLHVMDIPFIENVAGYPHGSFREDPDAVYVAFQRRIGTCLIDQYLATNPLSMTECGYDGHTSRTATTGAATTTVDGMLIDGPDAVVEHLERFVFPQLEAAIAAIDPNDDQLIQGILRRERGLQALLGPSILKAPHGEDFGHFPCLRYTTYGYANYLMAYVMYPEIMEKDFALQADLALLRNQQAVRAIFDGGLPRVIRLDHDMADSRGTLVDIRTLDRLWFPHFERAIRPYLEAGIRSLWHCDGNLMAMVPRLIEVGIGGFQGFQYEDGMDYESICKMTTRDGAPLMIWAGVSVTRTLPFGAPDDVRKELDGLVRHGPPAGLFLGASSSITPGVKWDNLRTLIEGLHYYRTHGRG
jgi:hypothetical protein